MADISSNLESLRSLGKDIESKSAEYAAEVKKIYTSVDNLRNGWAGPDNQSYVTRVNEHKEQITELGKVIDDYGRFLQVTANQLGQVQQDISNAAGRL